MSTIPVRFAGRISFVIKCITSFLRLAATSFSGRITTNFMSKPGLDLGFLYAGSLDKPTTARGRAELNNSGTSDTESSRSSTGFGVCETFVKTTMGFVVNSCDLE